MYHEFLAGVRFSIAGTCAIFLALHLPCLVSLVLSKPFTRRDPLENLRLRLPSVCDVFFRLTSEDSVFSSWIQKGSAGSFAPAWPSFRDIVAQAIVA
ncbi:unnamed protein product [Closterium sp. NIES-64]|nr:unnamed protein product [Closterium sp. NIES-64]